MTLTTCLVFRLAVFAVFFTILSTTAFAQNQGPVVESQSVLALGTQLTRQLTTAEGPLPASYHVQVQAKGRPATLIPMYAAQGVLQGLDVYTTVRALDAGHREANPMFKSGNPATMIGTKLAVGAVNVFAAEKLWKKNPKAATALMLVTNVLMTGVVAHNVNVLQQK
jgi:hypothetical protein